MSVPNQFIADLPGQDHLSAKLIREACQSLRSNGRCNLAAGTTAQIIELLVEVAGHWMRPDSLWRRRALEEGPRLLGFSKPVLESGLDAFFQEITPDNLRRFLRQNFGDEHRLDRFVEDPALGRNGASMVRAPELLVHIAAGNVPVPALHSLLTGLILRSSQFLKCASGTSLLPRLFGHSICELDPKIGACLEIAEWPGARDDLTSALLHEADCVTATGRDETLESLRRTTPETSRFIGYGHKISFGFITRECLTQGGARQTAERLAEDIVAWDQLGCLSPHDVYLEEGGAVPAARFAELLAEILKRREHASPRGPVPVETAAAIALKRDFYRIRADQSEATRLWHSEGSTAWTVVYEADPLFQVSCLHRFIYVKPAESLAHALHAAEAVRSHVSTVGLAAPPSRESDLARSLAQWGAPRICPLGQMQRPPLGWHHDGRPALGDLVTWIDLEKESGKPLA